MTLGKVTSPSKPLFPEMITSIWMGHWEDQWQNIHNNQHLGKPYGDIYLWNGSHGLQSVEQTLGPSPFPGQNVMAQDLHNVMDLHSVLSCF